MNCWLFSLTGKNRVSLSAPLILTSVPTGANISPIYMRAEIIDLAVKNRCILTLIVCFEARNYSCPLAIASRSPYPSAEPPRSATLCNRLSPGRRRVCITRRFLIAALFWVTQTGDNLLAGPKVQRAEWEIARRLKVGIGVGICWRRGKGD